MAITGRSRGPSVPSPVEVRGAEYIREVWSNWRFWRVRTSASISVAASASACPFPYWRTWCRTPSAARSGRKDDVAVPRITDIYSALPSITGKLELEYEGELKGGDTVARELIRVAVGKVYNEHFEGVNVSQIVQWFDLGGSLKLDETVDSARPSGNSGKSRV
jgi:magnesium chelatase subunit I